MCARVCVSVCLCVFWCVCDVLLKTEQNRHTVQLSLTLIKSSQATLIPPEGHCQNNKQLGFFKESYLSRTGERRVCARSRCYSCCGDLNPFALP